VKNIFILFCFFSFKLLAQKSAVQQINTAAEFMNLQGRPLTDIYTRVASVKLCYVIAQDKMFYIPSEIYRYHIDFCSAYFHNDAIDEFNSRNYAMTIDREYVLATLNKYVDREEYILEFVSEEEISADLLNRFSEKLKSTFKLPASIKILVNNTSLLTLKDSIHLLPIYPEDIFGAQTEQSLVVGTACGRAVHVKSKKDWKYVKPSDIIFIHGTPISLPFCAGVVTDALQTPLSHINVLCNNRGIPAAVIKNYESKMVNQWDSTIRLSVKKNSVSMNPCKSNTKVITRKVSKITYDQRYSTIRKFTRKTRQFKSQIGAKAVGMQELYKIQASDTSLFQVPQNAFAIPFYYFDMHTKTSSITKLRKYLAQVENKDSILKLIRKAIKDKPIDQTLLAKVNSLLSDSVVYRFRSSSNAEDLPGFNGAGLYTSARGMKNKDIEKAIKRVWASVYNDAAYAERQQFRIDESTVSMAILVHEGFPDEEANGVAVTKNLYRPSYSGFTVNVQYGETSVVQPEDSIICDQMILMPEQLFKGSGTKVYAQYITRSNIKPIVLSNDELYDLYFALEHIKTYFYNKELLKNQFVPYEDFGLDIEFKFDEGKLYVKQVRPYK
jgi:hypothetical protein